MGRVERIHAPRRLRPRFVQRPQELGERRSDCRPRILASGLLPTFAWRNEPMSNEKSTMNRELALVTGASTGIGKELARCCAENGYDLVIAADESNIHTVARDLESHGIDAIAVEADLATPEGIARLVEAIPRDVAVLMANVGRGLGHAFLDQVFHE